MTLMSRGLLLVDSLGRREWKGKDVMSKNISIYKPQASAREAHAAPDCKVLVVANPEYTNAFSLKEFAPSIPEKNIV